jgi:hypothetical protein
MDIVFGPDVTGALKHDTEREEITDIWIQKMLYKYVNSAEIQFFTKKEYNTFFL